MTDHITDERLREMANGATIYGHERNAIAAELLAARADLRKTIKLIGDAWACQEPGDWQNEAWELIEKYRYLS